MLSIKKEKIEKIKEITNLFLEDNVVSFPIKIYNQDERVLDLVLVNEKDWKKAIRILTQRGYKKEFNLGELRENLKKHYSKEGFSIHLHKTISWNGVKFLDPKKVWERKVSINGFHYPCPEDEASIIIAHSFFENRFIDPYDFFRYFQIKNNLNFKQIEKNAKEFNWNKAYYIFKSKISKKEYNLAFKELTNASFSKLLKDLTKLRLKYILREIIDYFFVDIIWCHRNKSKY
ncbi:MAG: nucleotidyltransferase family protein, partial [Nanoarchaeota archaeon]|nr:nucleotidyltransferase family protein [Nanoarchaeota archaeon]